MKKMYEVSIINFGGTVSVTYDYKIKGNKQIYTSGKRFYFSDIILLQSTGLKDKNGKEIFEEDIVKDEDGEWIAQIIWNDTWAMFEPEIMWQEDKNCSYDIRMGRPERFEVIGNIHENPELLKEDSK